MRLFSKLSQYAYLSDDDRQKLSRALGRERIFCKRADIIDEGDDPLALNVVVEGWACRSRCLVDGREQIVSLLLPGDLYTPRPDRMDDMIITLTSVTFAQFSNAMLQEITARSPSLNLAFRREALAAAAIQREWTTSLGCRSGIERLAHLFCELHFRLAAVGLADRQSYLMPLTQVDLAHALGQTSVHINRTLMELRAQELITIRGRRLTINDTAQLAEIAHFDPAYLHFKTTDLV